MRKTLKQFIRRPKGRIKGRNLVNNTSKGIRLRQFDPVNNAFDTTNVPDTLVREMLSGILSENTGEWERILGRIYMDKTSLGGEIPRRDSRHTVPRGNNKDLGPAEQAQPHNEVPGEISYKALAQVGYGILTDEERISADHVFSVDEVNEQLEVAVRESHAACSRKLEERLESTTSNQTFDVTTDGNGDWYDKGSSSTFVDDVQYAQRVLVPGSDTAVMGPNVANIIARHKQFTAGINYFEGGVGKRSEVEAFLSDTLRIPNVFVLEVLLDSETAIDATSITPEWLFDDGFWLGYGTALVGVKPNHVSQDSAEIGRVLRGRLHELMFAQYVDIPKNDADLAEMGVTFTEIGSTA
jgi:hypothetical protein